MYTNQRKQNMYIKQCIKTIYTKQNVYKTIYAKQCIQNSVYKTMNTKRCIENNV